MTWIRNNWLLIVSSASFLAIGIVGALLVARIAGPQSELNVVHEWNQAISKLGIEPVFPPEEDIYVGDVFAVITADRRNTSDDQRSTTSSDRRYNPLLTRAIKVHSEPMFDLLAEVYKGAPLFPSTKKKPATDGEAWEIEEKKGGIFSKSEHRGYLALAAFPGFSIKVKTSASSNVGWLESAFSGSAEDNNSVELRIPFAETYGVTSVVGSAILDRLCETKLGEICSDAGLRRHLSHVAGRIDQRAIDPTTNTLRYLVDVELAFVNRVYIARSIEQRRATGSWNTIGASYRANSTAATPPIPPSPANSTPIPAPSNDGTATANHDYRADASLELKQVFQRPVVFGYRAIKKQFAVIEPLSSAPKKPESDGK